jgi:hypothetical protein
VTDCPNCGTRVEPEAALCGSCGFDLHTSVADEVRRLRNEGRIKPGRLDPRERSVAPTDASAGEEPQGTRAEHFDAGL